MGEGVVADLVSRGDDSLDGSGWFSAFQPSTWNCARTEYRANTSSTRGVKAGSGPSSKVNAITGSVVSTDHTSRRTPDGAWCDSPAAYPSDSSRAAAAPAST